MYVSKFFRVSSLNTVFVRRCLLYLFPPAPALALITPNAAPAVDLFRGRENEEFLPGLTLKEKARGILNTMNGTLSKKQLERFLEYHFSNGHKDKVVFPALITFCVDDEFVREQVDVEAHIHFNTGYVRLCASKTALAHGFPAAYDTRFNLMKFSEGTLVITSRPGIENDFVIWIRHGNMPDPL